jgi:predicted permease
MLLPETILNDLRYGARILLRNPGFTSVSVLALALGIGVNTATFTAYKAMVARPIEAHDPGTMANLALILHSGDPAPTFSYPDYEAYRDHLHSFSGLIALDNEHLKLTIDSSGFGLPRTPASVSLLGKLGLLNYSAHTAELAYTFLVSENYFSVLGVPPLRGRTFESIPDLASNPSVLISENCWHRRFDGDPEILGKTVRLNGVAFTIAGITPHDFVGTHIAAPDFWFPLSLEPLVHVGSSWLQNRDGMRCRVFGRLAPGVTVNQAQAEMTQLAGQLSTFHDPQSASGKPPAALIFPASPFPLPMKLFPGFYLAIILIMIAAGMVLVVACANVASLQLARASSRQNELSMRLSLGASRIRLVRQLVTESALLGLIAGAAALPVTWALLDQLATKFAEVVPPDTGTIVFHVTPGVAIFSYVFTISLAAGILFGLAPAMQSSRSAMASAIRNSAGGTSPGRSRLRNILIGAQVAVSLVLLIAGSMLIRSSARALHIDTGYDANHVVSLSLEFPEGSKYPAARRIALVRELRTRLAALPGVTSVTTARPPSGEGVRIAPVSINADQPAAQIFYTYVEANYFQTLGIPLTLGHSFQSHTGAIVSESAARRLWPGENPIGRSLRIGTGGAAEQVIGVASDTRGYELDGSDSAQVYLPLADESLADFPILIRTRSGPAQFMKAIDSVISSVDPELVASAQTLDAMLKQAPAFTIAAISAAVASMIGLLGLVLATMGIYGTVSYIVVCRTREVGIRMAIGARKRDILSLILNEITRPVLAGLLTGMFLAIGATYVLRNLLNGLSIVDPVSFAGVSLFFLSIALAAAYPPSRRAMRVDPMVALRYE